MSAHNRLTRFLSGVYVHVHRYPNGTIDVFLDRGAGREHELFIKHPVRHCR